jgi:DNA (cytosine-5)-methyltransferase 1
MGDSAGCPSPTNGHWRDADWLCCRDGKWRPVEPGTSPLAYGAPARVGRLRAYGNAIVPALAAEILIATATLIANRLKPVANGGTDGL